MFGPSKRSLLRILERERLAAQQERMLLLDRLAHAYRQPWTPPPAATPILDPEAEQERARQALADAELEEL